MRCGWRRAAIGTLTLALLPWATLAAEESGTDACRDRAVAAVQSRYEDVRDFTARFEQSALAAGTAGTAREAVVSSGRVVLAKPGKMRWTYEAPQPSLVVSDGETLWIYDPEFGEAQKLPAGGEFFGGAAARFLLGAGDMRRDFVVRASRCGPDEAELELVPKQPASYEKLFLVVDPVRGDVRGTRVVDLVGSVSSVAFREVRLNTGPDPADFRFEPPEGVRVIELPTP